MVVTSDIYEWSTAITNMLWVGVLLFLIIYLSKFSHKNSFKAMLWKSALWLLLLVNLLGFIVHGLDFSANYKYVVWAVINFLLGIMITLLLSAALYDYSNKKVMLKILPFLVASALMFFTITQLNRDTFLVFVAYQAIATLLIFFIYTHLALKKVAGAWLISIGVLFLILAAVAQAIGRYELDILVPLNQDGIYHIIGIPGSVLLILGVVENLKTQ